jgi:hypothetical protein
MAKISLIPKDFDTFRDPFFHFIYSLSVSCDRPGSILWNLVRFYDMRILFRLIFFSLTMILCIMCCAP